MFVFSGKIFMVLCVIAAVLGNESAAPPKNGSLYTEDDWNDTSSIKNNEAYWLSKVRSVQEHKQHASFCSTIDTLPQ